MASCWDNGCLYEAAPGIKVATLKCFECIFENLLHYTIQLGGIIAFIFLILGGFKYLTAGGDPKKVEQARNTLTYAILGLVLLLLAWFILYFVEEFTGVKVTLFKIG